MGLGTPPLASPGTGADDVTTVEAAHKDLVARLPERFDVLELLGQGTSGVVHAVFDRERGERVALKTLHRATGASLARFKNEFRGLADISHENLVVLHELFFENDLWFFTMELVRGAHFLAFRNGPDSRPRLKEQALRDRFAQLARAIRALHEVGRIHRDLKPANVLVETGGRVVVLDFGLVRDLRDGRAQRATEAFVAGTPAYLAPEQITEGELSAACDWYAFGCLLYEALTGAPPWAGATLARKLATDPAAPSSLVGGVPDDLDELCLGLLRRNPRDRPGPEEVSRLLGDSQGFTVPSVAPSARPGATTLVGRNHESAILNHWMSAPADRPRVAVIAGPSGIGKSTLAHACVTRAESGGALVFSSRCHQQESVPHNAWDGIVDQLADYLEARCAEEGPRLIDPALIRLFPVLGAVPGPGGPEADEPLDPNEERALAVRALRAILREIGSDETLVLYVDDFQWADADSVQLFRELLTGYSPPNLRLLLTHRTGQPGGGPAQTLFDDPEVAEVVQRLDLEPLPPECAAELLDDIDGVPNSARARILSEAAGNPYLLAELGRSAQRLHAEGIPFGLPNAVDERLSVLPESARLIFYRVSLLARPTPLRVALRCAERRSTLEDIRRLEVAGLVRFVRREARAWVEPYHDRLRRAVAERVSEDERPAHFRALAQAFEKHERRDSAALSACWKAAGYTTEAAVHAFDAARKAESSLAFGSAASWYDEALSLGTYTAEERRQILVDLGRTADLAGYGARAARAFRTAADMADSVERIDLLRRASQALLSSGLEEEGMQILSEVLAAVGCPIPAGKWAVLASLLWQRSRLRRRPLAVGSRPHTTRERQQLEALHVAVVSAFHHDPLRAWLFATLQVRRALKGNDEHQLLRSVSNFLVFAATEVVQKPTTVRAFEEFGEALLPRVNDPVTAAWFESARGTRAFLEGCWHEAIERLGAAERALREQHGVRWELTTTRRAYAAAVQIEGDMACIEAELRDWLADAERRDDREGVISHSLALGYADFARGDTTELPMLLERVRKLAGPSHDAQVNISWVEAFWRCYDDPDLGLLSEAYERLQYLHRSDQRFVAFFRAWNTGYEARVATALAVNTEGDERARWRREMRILRGRLLRENWPHATAEALQLEASQLILDGEVDRASVLLDQASGLWEKLGAKLFASTRRYAVARLLGDAQKAEALAQSIRHLGVADVERMVRAHVPSHRVPPGKPEL